MYSNSTNTSPGQFQLTIYYIDNHSETYMVGNILPESATAQDARQAIHRLLNESWWVLKLLEETVIINTKNILKVEVKPSLERLEGEGVFSDAERITALTRGR